jgi:hypothetical protein
MNLVNLELGKWVYLIIYLFFPILTLIYLIKVFGLEVKEDSMTAARRHIEQANYWADVALQAAQTQAPARSKSLVSLEHTIQRNMERAFSLLAQADSQSEEVKSLKQEYRIIEHKLRQVQMTMVATSSVSISPSRQ